VGSSNLDPLSLRRNYELNVLIGDPDTGGRMHDLFEGDLQSATRVDPDEWQRRSLLIRAAEVIARALASRL
jgi:cardiolipin synthase